MIAELLLFLAQQRATPRDFCRVLHPPSDVARGPGRAWSTDSQVCRLAIETDHELYVKLGRSSQAVATYIQRLVGYASDRFCIDAGVRFEIVYLAIYDTPADPWNATTTVARLDEVYAAGAPVPCDLVHMVSGALLGGGAAYIGTLCYPDSGGVAVSGNMAQITNNPVPGTWDFLVFAHELGHNFGLPHTHDYCPPLERCGTSLPCNPTKACERGTIMGYCHTCLGGYDNVDPWFHPAQVPALRRNVALSCIAGRRCQ